MAYIHTQNQNQLTPSVVLGQVSMVVNPTIISVRLNPASTAYFQAGTAVKYIDGVDGDILVDAVSGATDGPVAGVIIYNARNSKPVKGQMVEIAQAGSFVWLEASAAIARGANVSSAPGVSGTTDPQVTTDTTSTHFITGVAVDKAAAEGDLIRVQLAFSKLP